MDELKPCPFCGGDAEVIEGGHDSLKVRCAFCHIGTPAMTEEDPIEMWNSREDVTVPKQAENR
ncbi:Lar family restriction alleviation protein [Dongshaea marina]|uniref:Lar family restriction alleviation protein n=1 Tax=Dongshaea marina TaxID=2047966 RepID=UPI000D3EBB69|nr:Lar family restriction alleviation protein [Dongshaea marina]